MKHLLLFSLAILLVISSCTDSTTAPPSPAGSVHFDGSNGSFVYIPQVLDTSIQKFTVMFWFRVDSAFLFGGSDFTKLISFTEGNSTRFMFNLLPIDPPASAKFIMTGFNHLNENGTSDVLRFTEWSSDPPRSNAWTHVALTYTSYDGAQGNTDTSSMFLNGNPVMSHPMKDQDPFRFRIPNSHQDSIKIGVRTLGSIAHLAVYKRQLSKQEIQDRYRRALIPSQETALVGYWPLQSDLKDLSEMRHDGLKVGKGSFVNDSPF
jgi:hypothetical protein